ncbi:MAG: hypothetical protein RBQ72_00675 [Desulfobacterium sp.]|jgi:hypothetical protein|nr:hypothetical protein [Desulfobacterium sp.]
MKKGMESAVTDAMPMENSNRQTGREELVKFLFLESYFGGSYRDFALGLKEHSSHAG